MLLLGQMVALAELLRGVPMRGPPPTKPGLVPEFECLKGRTAIVDDFTWLKSPGTARSSCF
jgi:hypothetical protein